MFEGSLGTWTDVRKRSLIVTLPSLFLVFLFYELRISLWHDDDAALVLLVSGSVFGAGYGYWLLVGVVNRWKVLATEHGVAARYGPLPWIWRERLFPAQRIHGFLPSESITDAGNRRVGTRVLLSTYGIDVMEADGSTSSLVQGCGDRVEVSEIKRALEQHFGVAQPDL